MRIFTGQFCRDIERNAPGVTAASVFGMSTMRARLTRWRSTSSRWKASRMDINAPLVVLHVAA